MTTWELATPADVEEVRLLLQRVERAGLSVDLPPELGALTKKRAGAIKTMLREALRDAEHGSVDED
jgi:hypothetical protein